MVNDLHEPMGNLVPVEGVTGSNGVSGIGASKRHQRKFILTGDLYSSRLVR
jgi:hypothetical protein